MTEAMEDASHVYITGQPEPATNDARVGVDLREHQYAAVTGPNPHMQPVQYIYVNSQSHPIPPDFQFGTNVKHIVRPRTPPADVSAHHMISLLQPPYTHNGYPGTTIGLHNDASSISSNDSGVGSEPRTNGRPIPMHVTTTSHKYAPPLAEACTPPRDTLAELSHIDTPGEGYFSRENVMSGINHSHNFHNFSSTRLHHARRVAQSRGVESTPPAQTIPYMHRERTPSPRPLPVLDFREESMSPKPLLDSVSSPISRPDTHSRPSTHITSTPLSSAGREAPQKIVVHFSGSQRLKSTSMSYPGRVASTPAELERCNTASPMRCSPSPIPYRNSLDSSHTPSSMLAAIKLENSPVIETSTMDTSLTNIQWLGVMSGNRLVDGSPSVQMRSPNLALACPNTKTSLSYIDESSTASSQSESPFELSSQSMSVGAGHLLSEPSSVVWNDSGIVSDASTSRSSLLGSSVLGIPSPFSTNIIMHDHKDIRVIASEKQIDKISRECGRKKRPPYSYMHLIQMAISSREDKRMTLRDIYKWIEEKFPYYKYSPKQGWKNSIRHNLSLYDIFVRQKSHVPGQTGCSYWTLKKDCNNAAVAKLSKAFSSPCPSPQDETARSTQMLQMLHAGGQASPQFLYINNGTNSPTGQMDLSTPQSKPKKGPTPLLPKPPPMQAYALIPIQNSMPLVAPQPLVFSSMSSNVPIAPAPVVSCSPVISQASSLLHSAPSTQAGVQGTASDKATLALKRIGTCADISGAPQRKHLKVGRKASILTRRSSFNNGCNSQSVRPVTPGYDGAEHSGIVHHSTSFDSAFMDSTIDTSGQENQLLPGLPKPKLFRHKKPRKEKQQCRLDSGEKEKSPPQNPHSRDSGIRDIISSIDGDMISPRALRTPAKEGECLLTSTPFRVNSGTTGVWTSPVVGLTQHSGQDSFYINGLFSPENTGEAEQTFQKNTSPTPGSQNLGSLRDLGLPGLTPLKNSNASHDVGHSPTCGTSPVQSPNTSLNMSNQSFNRLIGDFHLDSMMEDGLPVDITGLLFESDSS